MVYSQLFIRLIIRLALLLGLMITFAYIFPREELLFTQLVIVIIMILQVMELVRYLNKTNSDLARFLDSMRDGDFNVQYTQSGSKSFRELHTAINQLAYTYRKLETENQAQFQFLTELVNQIEFGIITFYENGDIRLLNRQASIMLEIPSVSNWRNLQNPNIRFLEILLELPESNNQLIETKIGDLSRYFSVSIVSILILGKRYRIVSFQDIKSEIQHKEIEAWQKLIRILTHEIMNSVTPLVSLTDTMTMLLNNEDNQPKKSDQFTDENIRDLDLAVSTIQNRSKGILQFVTNYRKLTKIPNPELKELHAHDFIKKVMTLFTPELEKAGISVQLEINPLSLQVDAHLIEQVLINLIKNAQEALTLQSNPKIWIRIEELPDRICIHIEDNGPGIPSDKMDRVFVPFYTTKKEGSGIGLSICRQIMSMHGGFLELNNMVSERTRFSMIFPKIRN